MSGDVTENGTAQIDGHLVRLVRWGWDCIDCGGDFSANDRCDSCDGGNRIAVYVTENDARRFDALEPGNDRGGERVRSDA